MARRAAGARARPPGPGLICGPVAAAVSEPEALGLPLDGRLGAYERCEFPPTTFSKRDLGDDVRIDKERSGGYVGRLHR
jgi:hypothetical protein